MLAIASSTFDAPSETFIRDHIRGIAPGETVLLCEGELGVGGFGYPILSLPRPWRPKILGWRLGNMIARQRANWIAPGLRSADHRRIRAFFEEYRVEAALAEYGPMGCRLWPVCRSCDVPLYVHFHGYDASILVRDWRWIRRYRRMFDAAAGVIAPSKFLASRLVEIGCPEAKLHVSPYGVDAQRFTPTQRLPQRLVAVARLVEKKAPHLTIEAFGRLRGYFPEAELDMVGDGPLADRCQTLIRDFGLGDCVRMHGVKGTDFVADLLQQASIFVQHSVTALDGDSEGLPVAILEAMSAALPVVATRHSGIPEAVEEGVTGLLVGEHDVAGMATSIAALLQDPLRAAAMGMAGRQRVVENFTQERMHDRLRAIMVLPPVETATSRVA